MRTMFLNPWPNIREQGKNDFSNGRAFDENPYTKTTHSGHGIFKSAAWQAGWIEAKNEWIEARNGSDNKN